MASNSTSFRPGQSGNPGGRPKENPLPNGRTLRELAREHTVEAIETLIAIAEDKTAPASARVSAAVAVLDRGYGKPAQTIADEDGNSLSWFDLLTNAQRRANMFGNDDPTIQ